MIRADSKSAPATRAQEATQWFHQHEGDVAALLDRHGALLFRGFALHGVQGFAAIRDALGTPGTQYIGGATPRAEITDGVYESTRWPAFFKIRLHNEMSYLEDYPDRIAFFCTRAADQGGETTICDVARVCSEVPPETVEAFRTRRVRYVRTFLGKKPSWIHRLNHRLGNNIHRTWEEAFGCSSREDVEAKCVELGLDGEWLDDGSLRVCNVLDGVISHPVTSQDLWFNQATSMNPNRRSLGWVYHYIRLLYRDPGRYPFNATYGDGEAIPMSVLEPVYDALDRHEVPVRWQESDLLLLDNRRVAHGRNPYRGQREVVVSLLRVERGRS